MRLQQGVLVLAAAGCAHRVWPQWSIGGPCCRRLCPQSSAAPSCCRLWKQNGLQGSAAPCCCWLRPQPWPRWRLGACCWWGRPLAVTAKCCTCRQRDGGGPAVRPAVPRARSAPPAAALSPLPVLAGAAMLPALLFSMPAFLADLARPLCTGTAAWGWVSGGLETAAAAGPGWARLRRERAQGALQAAWGRWAGAVDAKQAGAESLAPAHVGRQPCGRRGGGGAGARLSARSFETAVPCSVPAPNVYMLVSFRHMQGGGERAPSAAAVVRRRPSAVTAAAALCSAASS